MIGSFRLYDEKSAPLERKHILEKVKASFGIITRLYIILIILLIVKPAYTGSVSEQKMQDGKVTSGECLEVLEKGNFMPVNDTNFYRIFYDGHLYIMTIKYMGIIKHYSCDMKIKLIKNKKFFYSNTLDLFVMTWKMKRKIFAQNLRSK